MSFFDSNSSNSTTNSSDACENCSSSFTIFKRKKSCHICRQQFCQSCVNRQQLVIGHSCSSTTERICVLCQVICLPHTTIDDLMKYKLKHLRSILNAANVATNTCKEKRDLAELVIRNNTRIKFIQANNTSNNNNQNNSRPQSQPRPNDNTGTNPQAPNQTNNTNNAQPSFNNPFSSFMNNVQDFVNFNINSVSSGGLGNMQMPPQPMPAPHSSTSTTTTTGPPPPQQHNTNNSNQNNASGSSSSSSNNSQPRFQQQVPNVLNQTFSNNQFTFNDLFNNGGNTQSANQSSGTSSSTRYSNSTPGQANETTNTHTPQHNQSQDQQTTNSDQGPSTAEPAGSSATASNNNIRRRASLSDIKMESDIDSLTIKQIKEILACNFVDYKGCCEKKELVEKTRRLYASYLENKRLENEIEENSEEVQSTESGVASGGEAKVKKIDEADLCKICMESLIDCVLLDCGHMVSCIKCGKRLAECPMCRQNIVRVIRVFKS